MRLLYSFSVRFYYLLILTASLFSEKAKLWIKGRKNIFQTIREELSEKRDHFTGKTFWFHCASLGEFEQGRPVMEKLRSHFPGCRIVLTFFSPSGYRAQKNYAHADHVFYLPLDTSSNAQQFISLVKPDAALFVKYEFWYNYLAELKRKSIPLYLVSGVFRDEQVFFRWYGGWFRKQLQNFSHFFVQDAHSAALLAVCGLKNVTVSGDTRFDRVYEIAQRAKSFPLVEAFKGKGNVMIMGSAWEEDEKMMEQGTGNGSTRLTTGMEHVKMIIAPHEINEKHLTSIEERFKGSKIVRYSKASEENVKDAQLLIIDNIGMLSSLYRYGNIAFIGGGFGDGIHNILEAAVFGMPVIFGPNYHKFNEAKELLELEGVFMVKNAEELKNVLTLLSDPLVVKMAGMICRNYVLGKKGASEVVIAGLNR